MDLQFVATSELVDELLRRYDVGVFIAGKNIGGTWTTLNQWRAIRESVPPEYTILGMLELFKRDLMRKTEATTKEVTDDEPDNEDEE
jgi:hypothetical protein